MEVIYCPECNSVITTENDICPNCGYVIKNTGVKCKKAYWKYPSHIVGLILLVMAPVLIYISVPKLKMGDPNIDPMYGFYFEHYQQCSDGYHEAKRMSESVKLFAADYRYIASEYEKLMDDDVEKMKKIEKKARKSKYFGMVAMGAGGIVGITGVFLMGKKYGIS